MKEVVLDTETTGLSVKDGHRVVEIGCIELEDLIPTKNKFHCYLNPQRKVSEKALAVHGYNDEFLSKQKKFSEIGEEFLDFIKNKMSGKLAPDVEEKVIGSAEILEIFKVSKVGKVAGSKVMEGEISNDSNVRLIRDGAIIYNGKIGSIFREKNQAKQVSAGLECGITLRDFSDFQKKDIIEAYNSKITERMI